MMRRFVSVLGNAVLVVVVGSGGGVTPAGSGPDASPARAVIRVYKGSSPSPFPGHQSNNWSGYDQGALEKGHTFHAITADWTVPTASAHQSGEQEFSATWIGLGGGCVDAGCLVTDATLIQAGTEQDIAQNASGQSVPQYGAWYELIPAPAISVPLAIAPGDAIHADIHEVAPGAEVWSITLADRTTGQAFQTTVPYSSTYATAEWVEETPVVCCPLQVGPLPSLSTVPFRSATANGQSPDLAASEGLQLVDFSGNVLATPSAPDPAHANAFNVCTYATSCPAPKP